MLLSRWALQAAGMISAEALIDPRNVASQRVREQSGFRSKGRLRSYLDRDERPADALAHWLPRSDLKLTLRTPCVAVRRQLDSERFVPVGAHALAGAVAGVMSWSLPHHPASTM